MDKYKLLSKFDFISRMEKNNSDILVNSIVFKKIPLGMIIFGDNGNCKGVPLIVQGNLRLFRVSENGREMTVYKIGKGELCVLAAICILGDLEYEYSVEAETNCIIADIPPDIFKLLLDTDKAFKTYVFNTLAEKLIISLNKIEMVNFTGIEERILNYLEMHSDDNNLVKTTHEKIAIELGTSREVISRQIKKMADRGMLIQKRGFITLIRM